jgi:hypothetical protein
MDHELQSLKADLHRMQARIDELETASSETVNRRNMLRGLGAAAIGAAAGGLAFARPAAATDGAGLVIGNTTQTATTPTWLLAASGYDPVPSHDTGALHVSNTAAANRFEGRNALISAIADGDVADPEFLTGFFAAATTATPASVTTTGAILDGTVPLKLMDSSSAGVPPNDNGYAGQFRVNGSDLFYCVHTGDSDVNPAVWRQLTGLEVAGSYHPTTPTRVYDSRIGSPAAGKVVKGTPRTVSVKDAINLTTGAVTTADFLPPGATAIHANITITSTEAGGNILFNPGGDTTAGSSLLNWGSVATTAFNAATLKLNDTRQLTAVVEGTTTKTKTHVIIDILGYYL